MRVIVTFIAMLVAGVANAAPPLRDGDIIIQTSRSGQSIAIQKATHSPYSHMGVILHGDGKPYDLYFEWTDERIYCSELVWKMYRAATGLEIGSLQKLRELDLGDPAVKSKMRERYGKNIPLDERMISPAAMFESRLLTTVD